MPRDILFIHSDPSNRSESASRKRAHAHAARVAHAKRSRFRLVEYPAGTARTTVLGNQTSTTPQVDASGTTTDTIEAESVPSPRSLLSSARSDPFSSFARTFTRVEHYLLDHC